MSLRTRRRIRPTTKPGCRTGRRLQPRSPEADAEAVVADTRLSDQQWRRIRPDRVLPALVKRRAFSHVSDLCGEDIPQRIAMICSAFLHETLTRIDDKTRYEHLRLRRQRYLIHAKRADAQGDEEDARFARGEAARIASTMLNERVERWSSITDDGTVVFLEGVDLRSPREMAMKEGPREHMLVSQHRGHLVMKLSAVLVADGMRLREVKKLTVPTILRALQSAYPDLLKGSFVEAEKRLARYLRDRARICLNQGTPRDELLGLAHGSLSKGPRFFSPCPAWHDYLNGLSRSHTKPPQGTK